ncbi:rhomboid family intramembrane serine protease [Terriglobus roseus]|uniref:Rhomboid protease GluP n=1 Tax=Terriglobus roseus TaxID=392734 RepID=A0A1H4QAD1_9BACT|nr:rhomboid family intramembrane serine protease [Terriglobus roseus]SEC16575.1 rhomboid protease GluP [Terriglobus roseus]
MNANGTEHPFNPFPEAPADDVRREDAALQQSAQPVRHRGGGRMRSFAQAPATYILLGINIAVYLWMVLSGIDALTPTPDDLMRVGANNAEAVLAGHQWFRILSAMFVHVGIVHLGLNMWCLWNLGVIGEPLLGVLGMFCVYLLTGAAGNLLSVAVNFYTGAAGEVGAGASGAVFGIAGVLIVLFSNKRLAEPRPGFRGIPLEDLRAIRRSVIQFAVLNLVIGLSTNVGPLMRGIHMADVHIDNMAHIGGFTSGLAMAIPLVPRMTSGRERYLGRQKVTFAGAALAMALFGYFLSHLQ